MKLTLILSLLILSLASQAFEVKGTANTFKSEMAVRLKKLGTQCVMSSEADYLQSVQKITDPDLLISDSEFDRVIANLNFQMRAFDTLYNTNEVEKQGLCFMNRKEISALIMYSMDAYHQVNAAYRNNDENFLSKMKIYLKFLNSALDKIKDYQGYVRRGANTDLQRYQDHTVGAVVTYPAYTSTSTAQAFAGNVRTLIYSKSCKYIAPFSAAPEEEEVLCKPGTKFVVRYRADLKKVLHLILEEKTSP